MGKREEFEIGHKFGNLSLIEEIAPISVGGRPSRMMRLECVCGNIVDKQLKVLRLTTRCCGCTHIKPGYPPSVSLGDKFTTNEGYTVEVIEYVKHSNITVRFLDLMRAEVKTTVQAARLGSIANPYHPSVYGIACYGEPTASWKECKKLYSNWVSMIERVHVIEALDKRPTYRQCSIEKSWYNFANFYSWAKDQVGCLNKGWQMDKDILVKGNKHYSPETCCFVPSQVNALFTKRESGRGQYPIGVMEYTTRSGKRSLKAEVCDPDLGKRISGAGGCTIEECFLWYKKNKEAIIKRQADKYKGQIDHKVYLAMYEYQVEITD